MTTGRINQVTIVRRGRPPPVLQGGELVTGASAWSFLSSGRPAAGGPHWQAPGKPTEASAFPLYVPQATFGGHEVLEARAGCRLGRPGGVLAPEVQLFSVPYEWVSPGALLNFGQGPVVFQAQPSSVAPKAPPLQGILVKRMRRSVRRSRD